MTNNKKTSSTYIKNKEYLKYEAPERPEYFLYKMNIYKIIKFNDENHIIKNIETEKYYKISWGLYQNIAILKTIEEAKIERDILGHPNLFLKNQISIFKATDIFNFNYLEKLRPYTMPRTQKICC